MARIIMIIMTAFVLVVSIPSYILISVWVDILDGYFKKKEGKRTSEQRRPEKGSGKSKPDGDQGGEGCANTSRIRTGEPFGRGDGIGESSR